MEHPGFAIPPDLDGIDDNTERNRFKYFEHVPVGPVKFGVAAVNEHGEGPCTDGPEPPTFAAFAQAELDAFDQMVGLAGCTLNPGDIWCGAASVGDIIFRGSLFARGYLDVTGLSGGSFVGDTAISVGSNSYTFQGLYVPVGGSFVGDLIFRMDADLTTAEKATLELHIDVDGTTTIYPMSEFADSTSEGQMIRDAAELDWSSAAIVTAGLRTADNS
ncbi:hypothetical protein [Candidatus Poriferisodalis sp.]|uniref:hypothetical protein n=1 Tax=Candidatus Poriferisodalis sp. TaxID=3101277 RepID=UPI003B595CF2